MIEGREGKKEERRILKKELLKSIYDPEHCLPNVPLVHEDPLFLLNNAFFSLGFFIQKNLPGWI